MFVFEAAQYGGASNLFHDLDDAKANVIEMCRNWGSDRPINLDEPWWRDDADYGEWRLLDRWGNDTDYGVRRREVH